MKRDGVTAWLSVPSLAQKIALRGNLDRETLARLRISLFCGEALLMELAGGNRAGGRELVRSDRGDHCLRPLCNVMPAAGATVSERFGLAPIGQALPGMKTLILREDGRAAPAGETSELLVSGSQLADGYLADPKKIRRPLL
nr:hypothetical protein [Amylibacter sp.]